MSKFKLLIRVDQGGGDDDVLRRPALDCYKSRKTDQFIMISKIHFNFYLLVVYVVFPIYFNQIVNKQSSGVHHSEKMRLIKFFIWLLWLLVTNAELTLESVNRKVNDLEVEMTALKVFHIKCNR